MQPAGSVLPEVIEELLRVAPRDEVALLAWPIVCGPKVAARTRPTEFRDGILRVQVPGRAWCQQLSDLEQSYCREFARLLGRDIVRQIVFVEG